MNDSSTASSRLARRWWLPPPGWPRVRGALGLFIWIGGSLAALEWVWRVVITTSPAVELAFWGGAMAALATALGTLPALLATGSSTRTRAATLGFSAGVMLAACAFSLIVPALRTAELQGATPMQAAMHVAAAVLFGAALLLMLEIVVARRLDPGHHRAAIHGRRRAGVWLFVLAVMLHNVPEGLAIGVGFAGESQSGRALATGIAIQDVPEGLVVAMALRGIGYGRLLSVAVGALSGLSEPVAAVIGALVVGASSVLLVPGLALAAGAMLFVIGHSVIPEGHRSGHARLASGSLVVGFVLMLVLDTALG